KRFTAQKYGRAASEGAPTAPGRRASSIRYHSSVLWLGGASLPDARSGGPDAGVDAWRVLGLPRLDRGQLANQVAHLVGAGEKHQPRKRIDLEREILIARQMDDLRLEIDREPGAGISRDQLEQLAMLLGLDDDREKPVLEGIVPEDVGERGGQDRPDPPGGQGPRRVLARRAGPEVIAHEQDLAIEHGDAVHHEQRLLEPAVLVIAPIPEQGLAEALLVGHLEVAGRDDLVRIHVLGR